MKKNVVQWSQQYAYKEKNNKQNPKISSFNTVLSTLGVYVTFILLPAYLGKKKKKRKKKKERGVRFSYFTEHCEDLWWV